MGVSFRTVVRIVLSKIGGVPLLGAPAQNVVVNGTPPAVQALAINLMFTTLGKVLQGLKGRDQRDLQEEIFQNPASNVISIFSLSNTKGSVEFTESALFDACNNLDLTLSDLNTLAYVLSGSNYTGTPGVDLTGGGNEDGLLGQVRTWGNVTDLITGLTESDPEIEDDYGFAEVTNTLNFIQNLINNLPSDVDQGGFDTREVYLAGYTSDQANITAPIDITSNLYNTSNILIEISDRAANATLYSNTISHYSSEISNATTLIVNSIASYKDTIGNYITLNASLASAATAASALSVNATASSPANAFLERIIKPIVLDDVRRSGPNSGGGDE